ncbi:Uncharacterised protein [uncultured archaeon]|nr:Uncharacterised protein [uncultured archaeon]
MEDAARYEQNKKTTNGKKLGERLQSMADDINQSGFGIDYRARFGTDIADETRRNAIERVILGGKTDDGVSFYKIYSPEYSKDAQGYIDNFLTPLHTYLKEAGIDSQALVDDIRIGGESIGMQVRFILPQDKEAIDAALRQKAR